jgi:hypothetical protein
VSLLNRVTDLMERDLQRPWWRAGYCWGGIVLGTIAAILTVKVFG